MALLELNDLVCAYDAGPPVLNGLSLAVNAGEAVGVIGPNGAGKTTTALALAGFLNTTAGEISFSGNSIGDDFTELRRSVGFTFHNPDDQLFMPTVLEEVAFAPLNRGFSASASELQAHAMLEELGLGCLAGKHPGHLSAGEKRMVSIAAILVVRPLVLVLDEPSAFLDPFGRRQLIELLNRLEQAKIIITHDLELVLETCGRVALISDGRLAAEGHPEGLLRNRDLLFEHRLEVPPSLSGSRARARRAA